METRSHSEWEALEEAIAGLYATFASYGLRRIITGCPHCVGRADSDALHVRPLGALSPDDLRRYTTKALTTFGDVDDFKHFLPRLLELLAREVEGADTLGYDEEILGGKLALANYASWPEAERAAVEAFLDALWAALLARFPTYPAADTLLGMLANRSDAPDAIDRYLAAWRETRTRTALGHVALASFDSHGWAFWPTEARKRFEHWLAEDETFAMVRLAADEWREGAYRGELPSYVELSLSALAGG